MTRCDEPGDRLVLPVLRAADLDDATGAGPRGAHPDEETLALFTQGALAGPERDAAVAHLAACPECRQTVSLVLSLPAGATSPADAPAASLAVFRLARRAWLP